MTEIMRVRRAAVLGAGVMGAQIAAHLANAGIETLLFELADDGADRRASARQAIQRLRKLQPAPLAAPDYAAAIQPANYDDDPDLLADCDLVIEAVAERLDIKKALFGKLAAALPDTAVVGSNTSGLSINAIADVLPPALRPRFCGIHFFNPPRYMHLVELTPSGATTPAVANALEAFLTATLGKGVVRAQDTPNFIGNRIGVFSIVATMHHAARFGIPIDVVDALTGTAIGRAKSATFRTADVVGLDTLKHVVEGSTDRLADDPWVGHLALPDWMNRLVDQGALGQKTGVGVYRKEGGTIRVLEPESGDYRDAEQKAAPEVAELLAERDPVARFRALRASEHPQAQFLWAIHRDLFHYAAHLLGDIADNARDIDLALRWGFGWQQGPFELWQAIGWEETTEAIGADIAAGRAMAEVLLPGWTGRLEAAHTAQGSWAPEAGVYRAPSQLAVYRRQYFPARVRGSAKPPAGETTLDTEAVRLWHLDPEIGILSFRTRSHAIGAEVLDGILEALGIAEQRYRSLVLWQDSEPFSVGADLKQVTQRLEAGDHDSLEHMVARFQEASDRLRYASIPVVAGVRGMALGGACELIMHCDHAVAALESYVGLVEAGVGLIPGGGGCKELARRAAQLAPDGDPFPHIRSFFEPIAKAEVAPSAALARRRGLLGESATVVMHSAEVLHVASAQARALAETAYRPALKGRIRVAGREGLATLEGLLVNMHAGGNISDHDYAIARYLAAALCGGEVETGMEVDEAWLLRLEREGFAALLRTPETAARIRHTLDTGKPLRN